jgi:hypothetical protein
MLERKILFLPQPYSQPTHKFFGHFFALKFSTLKSHQHSLQVPEIVSWLGIHSSHLMQISILFCLCSKVGILIILQKWLLR